MNFKDRVTYSGYVYSYNKRHAKDKGFVPLKSTTKTLVESIRGFAKYLSDKEIILRKRDLKKMDTIDYSSKVSDNIFPSDLPRGSEFNDEEYKLIKGNWYLIVPPFEEGVLRLNKSRYFHFMLTDLNVEERSIQVTIVDYGLSNSIWIIESITEATIFIDISKDSADVVRIKITGGCELSDIMKSHIEKDTCDLSDSEKDILRETIVPFLEKLNNEDDFGKLISYFVLGIVKANIDILNSKPKIRKEKVGDVKVKCEAGEVDKSPAPHVIRTFKSGIVIKSEKAPKLAAREIIRRYTKASWKTIGHLRHYKSGKVSYIRPSIHHRKCLKGDVEAAQVVIKIG